MAFFIAAATLLIAGCGDDSKRGNKEESSKGVAASTICDGTLDTEAAGALQRLAGTNRFEEGTGTNEAGEPRKFSLRNTVEHLHDEYRKRGACWVYTAGDDSGEPLLEIRFSASSSHPSASQKESSGQTRYPLGVYANTGPTGADLFFQCTTKAPSKDAYIGDAKYVKAELLSTATKIQGDSSDKDRMLILNSISRKLAQEAGCASEADLPTTVPSQ
ncbi:hypothetical protein [Streptomyces monashensis]|uniref:hypothetical protein n=1 Tax=Streptomyces monashensis TaxID=1678012 RepID=UPI0011603E8B|nr:hypothetical protein [Streptomyces monashensis]